VSIKATDISRVLVIGAGTMGEGIAQNFAQAGLEVCVADNNSAMLERCGRQIPANLETFKEFSLLDEEPAQIMDRITFKSVEEMADLGDLASDVDYAVEAVSENLELKQSIFAILSDRRDDLILASNSSSLTISEIAQNLKNPGNVVGLHYFFPAHIVPLVEVHSGKDTLPDAITCTIELAKRVGKRPIHVLKEMPGLIVNRIQAAYNREVTYLLEQGVASAEDLDMAAKASYGFRLSCLGPLQIHDLNGLDIVLKAGGKTRKAIFNGTESSPLLVQKVEAGELGVKTGKGWHDYTGRTREEVLDESNRKLLKQLVTFNEQEKP
jgi:3-hydroxybutyryl-CoA dehydrogenase